MIYRTLILSVFFANMCCLPSIASELERVSYVLDFEQADSAENDELFSALDSHSGSKVYLELTIIPLGDADEDNLGYSIRFPSDPPVDSGEACGSGMFGMLDNVESVLVVELKHPAHFHSPTVIVVGDRMRFPEQEILCSSERYTEVARTPLIVRGYFSVQSAEVPTAVKYRLTPTNP